MLYNSTMDYYQILGINENASQDEIKKAYKKLAMKNHPDRGGDTQKFQEISQAHDTLSDPQKRQQYDAQKNGFNPFGGHPQGHGQTGPFDEMFGHMFGAGFAPFGGRQVQRNKDLTIRVTVSFKQAFLGTQVEARYAMPSGKHQTVVVDIPAGVQSGQVIRYGGLGDDTIPHFPRGNLNVSVMVEVDAEWERRGNDLFRVVTINAFEAMTGCTKDVICLDGTTMPLKIRAGITPGTEFASGGRGFRDINTGRTGNMIIVINVDMPAVLDLQLRQELEALYAKITKQ
jgi:curved DNA-binding protein